MTGKEIAKRYAVFIIGLFFIGLGVAFTKHAELGVSPISSVANVISCKFTWLSFGNWLFLSNCMLILGQIALLRKQFKPIQLLQIPLSFLLGYFTDVGMVMVGNLPSAAYGMKLIWVFCGIVVIGFGIALGVIADVILNSGEAFVKALADVTKKEFGTVKVIFDVCWVLLAAVLSLVLFQGQVVGVREGTVLSALLVGFVVKFFTPLLQKPLTQFLMRR